MQVTSASRAWRARSTFLAVLALNSSRAFAFHAVANMSSEVGVAAVASPSALKVISQRLLAAALAPSCSPPSAVSEPSRGTEHRRITDEVARFFYRSGENPCVVGVWWQKDAGFIVRWVLQLMELAGLSVAAAVDAVYPVSKFPRILVVCGPGNNGYVQILPRSLHAARSLCFSLQR